MMRVSLRVSVRCWRIKLECCVVAFGGFGADNNGSSEGHLETHCNLYGYILQPKQKRAIAYQGSKSGAKVDRWTGAEEANQSRIKKDRIQLCTMLLGSFRMKILLEASLT